MADRYEGERRRLEDAVQRGPGHLAGRLREALVAGGETPPDLQPLVAKVKAEAYRVTDEDIRALRSRYTEDELFEVVVCAALGAGLTRVRAALRALEDA
jgi:hypothetical protein